MKFNNFLGIVGALLVIAGGFAPMLRIPIIGNWNYWDLDTILASVVYALAGLALFGTSGGKSGLTRFCGWALLFVLAFTFIAVYFKVSNYFSLIPFKKLAAAASGLIKYKWMGWGLIFSGAIFILLSSKKNKSA